MLEHPTHEVRTAYDASAETLNLAVVVGTLVCLAFAALYYVLGALSVAAVVFLSSIPIACALPLSRALRRPWVGLQFIHLIAYVVLVWITHVQGGLGVSPAVWWLLALPYMSMCGGSYRAAAIWLGVVLGTIGLLYVLQRLHGVYAGASVEVPLAAYAINVAGLSFVILCFLVLVLRSRDRAYQEQQSLNARLTEAARLLEGRNEELRLAHATAVRAANAKSEFLANISHEIRTPMNGVLGMAELLQGTPLNTEQQHLVRTMKHSSEHLLSLINDVLDLSKLEADRMQCEHIDFDARELCEEVIEQFAERTQAKGLKTYLVVSTEIPVSVRGDPGRVRQILVNLLSNAIKFTEAGEVGLNVSVSEDGNATRLMFAVRDTGIGIAPDQLEQVFQSFSQADSSITRRYGGTGLGLTISLKLARLMGGDISVASAPGRGSTFTFTLALSAVRSARSQDEHADISEETRKIWICEPHQPSAEGLTQTLLSLNASCTALPAPLSRAGLARLNQEPGHLLICADNALESGLTWEQCAQSCSATLAVCVPITQPRRSAALTALGIKVLAAPPRRTQLESLLAGGGSQNSAPSVAAPALAALGLHIMIAEDNAVNRQVAMAMLNRLGCTADVAVDGRQAVDLWHHSERAFDLVLMDCQMPGMDGLTATREIRRLEGLPAQQRIPIIAVTANALAGDSLECMNAGMDDYISKPYTLRQLERTLRIWRMHLEDRRARDCASEEEVHELEAEPESTFAKSA